MRTLILDNHDSFTFNLFHLMGEVTGEVPLVVANDACGWSELADLAFDSILISPGPGTPRRGADLGLSADALRHAQVPLLGVCLGHQAMLHLAGGSVVHAPEPMHGRLEKIAHGSTGLFEGLPSPLEVVRYHSLVAAEPLPDSLRVTARSNDGLVMAIEELARPRWGVQFHPESICSQGGRRLLENFRDLSRLHHSRSLAGYRGPPRPAAEPVAPARDAEAADPYVLHARQLPEMPDAEAAFLAWLAEEPQAFWLDSARVIPGLSRWSFLGTGRPGPASLDGLQNALRRAECCAAKGDDLPFPFRGGWVGWIGYEAKGQCGYPQPFSSTSPDVALLFAERFLVLDHQEQRAWLAAVLPANERQADLAGWFDRMAETLSGARAAPPAPPTEAAPRLAVAARHAPDAYLHRIGLAQQEIRDGESYEVCLTNRLEVRAAVDPLTVYRHLRRLNPAPHAAYLRMGDLAVAGSSPERFLSASADGLLEAKPIKGTAPRSSDPEEDHALATSLACGEKDRAENLMIVDLLRHDLGRVAALGSVSVPALMAVESYATVHQLVSTVQAKLAPRNDVVDALRSAFPPGSMTGAPKRRTLEIIDRLEEGPRGIYSGALGWIGLDGAADLSVVIRTLVQEAPGLWSLGAGGAITALSDPQAELEEMYLKARAPLSALALAATGKTGAWRLMDSSDQAAE